jgi:hypothetical protein
VFLLQGDVSGSCTWQVPTKFVMLQCWPEAHAALQQMPSTHRFGEAQSVMPAEHGPPIGTGVGVGIVSQPDLSLQNDPCGQSVS